MWPKGRGILLPLLCDFDHCLNSPPLKAREGTSEYGGWSLPKLAPGRVASSASLGRAPVLTPGGCLCRYVQAVRAEQAAAFICKDRHKDTA